MIHWNQNKTNELRNNFRSKMIKTRTFSVGKMMNTVSVTDNNLTLSNMTDQFNRCIYRRNQIKITTDGKTTYQWRSQEFLSSGQFPNQTILRSGQPWAIEKQLGYSFFKTFYLYKSRCLLKRNFQHPQLTGEHARVLCTISKMYSIF